MGFWEWGSERRFEPWFCAILLSALSLQWAGARAQTPQLPPPEPQKVAPSQTASAASPQERIDQIQRERESVAGEMTAERAALRKEFAKSALETVRQRKLEALALIDGTLAMEIASLQTTASLADEERQYREAERKLREIYGDGVSVSFADLNQAREELAAQMARKDAVSAKLAQARTALKQARDEISDKEDAVESATTKLEDAPDDPALQERAKLAELKLRLARESVALREIALANQERTESAYRAHLTLLEEKVRLMRSRAAFTEDELKKQLQQIDSKEVALQREMSQAIDEQVTTKARLAEARERLARSSEERHDALTEEVEAKKLADEALKNKIENLAKRIDLIGGWRQTWKQRYAVFNRLSNQAKWIEWRESALDGIKAIDTDERVLNFALSDWQNRLITIQNKLGAPERQADSVRRWLERQRSAAQAAVDEFENHKAFIENTRRLRQQLVDSIAESTDHRTWREWVDLVLDTELGGNKVLHWLITATIATGLFLLLLFIRNFVITRWQHSAEEKKTPVIATFVASVRRTTTFFLLMISVFAALPWAKLDPDTEEFIGTLTVMALTLQAAIWLSYFFRSWIFEYLARKTTRDHVSLGTLTIFNFLSQAMVWSLATLLLLQNLGVNVTALITGLGVGGAAVALALQRILGDILSSLSIVFDKPFVSGDFIIFGENMGTVEHIGVKSTLIRSLSGEQLICSNSDLLNMQIRNFKRMRERRVVFQIGVVYETPHDKLARIPQLLRAIVEDQKGTRFDRAHFSAYGDFALTFEVVYYVLSADYNAYMDLQQAFNLAIFRRFEAESIEFAYPTQTLHLGQAMLPRGGLTTTKATLKPGASPSPA